MDWMSLLLGFPLGCLASLLAWWVVQHRFVPKIEFSPDISRNRYSGNPSGFNYRVKFKNTGRRDIIDVEVFVVIRNRGLLKGQEKIVEIASIPTDADRMPVIKAGANRIVSVNVHLAEKFKKTSYGSEINEKRKQGNLTLEDVLGAGEKAAMTLNIFGYDSWSGARKMYESPEFLASDIKEGRWDGMLVIADESSADSEALHGN